MKNWNNIFRRNVHNNGHDDSFRSTESFTTTPMDVDGDDDDDTTECSRSTVGMPTSTSTFTSAPSIVAAAVAKNERQGRNVDKVLTLSVRPQYRTVGMQHGMSRQLICATVKACAMTDNDDDGTARAPVDIIVALDVSGSMAGEPLQLCKRTLELLLEVLGPDDRFGLVLFDTEAKLECSLRKMTPSQKEAFATRIRFIEPRSMTNISHAIDIACDQMRRIPDPNQVQTILLLTDGHPNCGVSAHQPLVRFTKDCLNGCDPAKAQPGCREPVRFGFASLTKQQPQPAGNASFHFGHTAQRNSTGRNIQHTDPSGVMRTQRHKQDFLNEHRAGTTKATSCKSEMDRQIGLACFGYGSEHNARLLREMAETVHGSYYFVRDQQDVGSAFGDAIGGLLSTVATSVNLQIQLPKEAKSAGVQIVKVHYGSDALQFNSQNSAYSVNLGDFYAEESRDVIVEVKMADRQNSAAPNQATSTIPHLVVSGIYFDTLSNSRQSLAPVFGHVSRPTRSLILSTPDQHVQVQWLRIHSLYTMEQIRDLASNGSAGLSKARSKLAGLIEILDKTMVGNTAAEPVLQQLRSDITELRDQLKDTYTYSSSGNYMLAQHFQTHTRQRCMESSAAKANVYRNKKKSTTSAFMSLK